MHYYKKNLGGYYKYTGHLSALQHGIYTLLIDWYYIWEKPIPHESAADIAKSPLEEVVKVLRQFFEYDDRDDVWLHRQIEQEMGRINTVSNGARKAANARWENSRRGRADPEQAEPEPDQVDREDANASKSHSERNATSLPQDSTKNPSTPLLPKGGNPATEDKPKRKPRASAGETPMTTIDTFRANLKESGERLFPASHSIWTYTKSINLPQELVSFAWRYFRDDMSSKKKKQRDWRKTFVVYLKKNYLKLWYLDNDGEYQLTQVGKQAKLQQQAEDGGGDNGKA